jgi:hypothetical protein
MSTQTTTPTPRKLTKLDSEQGMLLFLAVLVLISVAGVLIVG